LAFPPPIRSHLPLNITIAALLRPSLLSQESLIIFHPLTGKYLLPHPLNCHMSWSLYREQVMQIMQDLVLATDMIRHKEYVVEFEVRYISSDTIIIVLYYCSEERQMTISILILLVTECVC